MEWIIMSKIKLKQLAISAGSNITIDSNGSISASLGEASVYRPSVNNITSNTVISNPSAQVIWVVYDSTSSTAISVTLPTAVGISGMRYDIKRSGTGTVTVNTTSSQTIDGLSSIVISSQYASLTVVSNGSNWIVI